MNAEIAGLPQTTSDVSQWLKIIECDQYVEGFSSAGIDGEKLLTLTEADLNDDFGVGDPIHRRYLLSQIQVLQKIQAAGQRRMSRTSQTFGRLRERSATWVKAQEPKVKKGVAVTRDSLGKGWETVSTFTKNESKLLYSQTKWAVYCRDEERSDEAEFVNTVNLVENWKQNLNAQKKNYRKVIKSQTAFENTIEEFTLAMQNVPDESNCSKSSIELGSTADYGIKQLLPTGNLELVIEEIENLLQNEYVEMQALKKNYDITKNNLVVCQVKMAKKETDSLKAELERLSGINSECKRVFREYAARLFTKQNTVLSPVLLRASQNTGGVTLSF